ncbi:cohesin domain-containing protein [Candidatus Uhrbacteria bacterium]|nr:cohesin domain-containing protein [Candidatus Uhrbacteria bacterium]
MKYRFFLASLLLFIPQVAFAASAGLSAPAEVQVGRTFQVRMNIGGAKDTDTVRFIGSFPTEFLEFQGMANGSSLPTRSPGSGASGGTFNFGGFSLGNPVSGNQLAGILTFKAKKVGTATISLVGGTRILSAGTDQLTGKGSVTIKIVEGPAPGEIPVKPPEKTTIDLFSNTHPDQDEWYSSRVLHLGWKLGGKQPISVTVGFDQAPEGPAETNAVSTSSAMFTAPSDGVWYGHLVLRYSASDVVRKDFRYLVDGTAPRPMAVAVDQTDVRPGTPNYLRFAALDDASGIESYEISINDKFVTSTSEQSYSLIDYPAGEYRVSVKAKDFAGNVSQGVAEFRLIEAGPSLPTVSRIQTMQEWLLRLALAFFIGVLLFIIGFLIGKKKKKDAKAALKSRSKKS